MAHLGELAAGLLAGKLRDGDELAGRVAAVLGEGVGASLRLDGMTLLPYRAPMELLEKHTLANYPVVLVYCREMGNELTEKFRSFSGSAKLVVEAAVSSESLEELSAGIHGFVQALVGILEDNRGEWTNEIYFGGGYEMEIGPVRRGGRHFVQKAECEIPVWIRKN